MTGRCPSCPRSSKPGPSGSRSIVPSPPTAACGEVEPGWGLDTLEYPSNGGGLVIWDSGSDPIPVPNEPPRTSRDPHEDPRANPHVQLQIISFLLDGQLVDVCGAGPCTAEPVD